MGLRPHARKVSRYVKTILTGGTKLLPDRPLLLTQGHLSIFLVGVCLSTKQSVSGVKTRHLVDITRELSQAIRIHKQFGSHLGGVHFELTGDRVTECVGGSMELLDEELLERYETHCDPRLNYEQALDMAFLIAKYQEKQRGSSDLMHL